MDGSSIGRLTEIINDFSNFVYQPYAIPALLLAVGGWLTYQTGFVQIRRFRTAWNFVKRGAFEKEGEGEGTITPFQALSTALAATVGNGNIGGVATAILLGGPGAIFWMWMCAAAGMATKYSEAIMGVHYRVTTEKGELASGPMYYIRQGIKSPGLGKALAYMFVYLAAGLVFVLVNVAKLPSVLVTIVQHAFTPIAAMGGFAGAGVASAIAAGISRGVLSNEAGLGSAPIAHGIAKVKHPAEQGVVGIFEVFLDTIVVCTMTAFIILEAGLWTSPAYQGASGDLTAASLNTVVPGATAVVALSSFLFGFSTLIGWCYYGEKCVEFMFGSRTIVPYRFLFTVLVMVGAVVPVPLVWALGTLLNGFMAFPNLIGLLALGAVVRKLTREYFSQAPA
jgi:AGCS family alanine or glycine:cation symporter